MHRGNCRHLTRIPGRFTLLWLVPLLLLCVTVEASGVAYEFTELRETTLLGFRNYVSEVEKRNNDSLGNGSFLWIDELPERSRNEAYAKLKQGDVVMRRLSSNAGGKTNEIPGAMIHDWEGMVFIPGATLERALAILQDYDRHSSYYAPDVERAKIESRDGNHFRVFMRFRRRKVVTVVLNTDQDIRYFRDSAARAHSRSTATRIREVADAGTKREREKATNEDNGFLWQMETWWRMEQRDGGVYIQNEAVTLTRDIPKGLGWLIEPFVTSIPKETLEFTLGATRKAVLDQAKQ